jgi:two-component system chemotaxis response regulator CheY
VDLCGFEIGLIQEAGNGKEALDYMNNHHFDLAIIDLNMPIMNGEEMIANMKANPATKDIPIIMVSAESNSTKRQSISEVSISFVHKPFAPEVLRDELLKLFDVSAIKPI